MRIIKIIRLALLTALLTGFALAQGTGYNAQRSFTTTIVQPDVTMQQNSSMLYHQIAWTVSGAPSGCTVSLDSSANGTSWTTGGIIAGQTCTSNGTSSVTAASAAYIRINVTALTGGTSPSILVNYTGWSNNPAGGGSSFTPTTTVGMDGVWLTGAPLATIPGAVTAQTPTQSTFFVTQMQLQRANVFGHFTVNVTTGVASEVLYVCLYNQAGTSLLWSANASVASTAIASGSAAQYTAQPGTYYVGFEQTGGASGAAMSSASQAAALINIQNQNGLRWTTSTNTVTGSACPTSINGTLSVSAVTTFPDIALEP
jgi:hypothetical protein